MARRYLLAETDTYYNKIADARKAAYRKLDKDRPLMFYHIFFDGMNETVQEVSIERVLDRGDFKKMPMVTTYENYLHGKGIRRYLLHSDGSIGRTIYFTKYGFSLERYPQLMGYGIFGKRM